MVSLDLFDATLIMLKWTVSSFLTIAGRVELLTVLRLWSGNCGFLYSVEVLAGITIWAIVVIVPVSAYLISVLPRWNSHFGFGCFDWFNGFCPVLVMA